MIERREREFVLERLVASEARLLELVEGLGPAQWSFREDAERWSIAEIVEHLVVFEEFITGAVTNSLQGPRSLERRLWLARKNRWFWGWLSLGARS